jgi:hypothetical protein
MMAAERRANAEKSGRFLPFIEMIDELGKVKVGQIVAVVGEEDFFPLEIFLDGFQSLADVGVDACFRKGDGQVVNIGIEAFDHLASAGKDEVVAGQFIVGKEEVLDGVSTVSQTQDEVFVPEVGVVLHNVPEDGPAADRNHRLGYVVTGFPDPQSQSTTKEYDFHRTPS